jgi:ribosomal protein S18 acetylase RimI-like enzyme
LIRAGLAGTVGGVEIRRLGPGDWELLRDVRLRSLADAPEAFGSTQERESGFDEAEWRSRAASNSWFIAIDDGEPLGIVAGYQDPDAPVEQRHLVAMWIAPTARGRGVAPKLIDAVVDSARDDGSTEVTLGVADGNERARAVYLKYGFVETDQTFPLHSDLSRCMTIYSLRV